jgi:hypothetical protein
VYAGGRRHGIEEQVGCRRPIAGCRHVVGGQGNQSPARRKRTLVLTLATLGLAGYGVAAVGLAVADLLAGSSVELVANLAQIVLGLLLLLSAAFVRVRIPGGLALALSGLLGLQALALHAAAHRYGTVALAPQVALGLFALALVGLALWGSRREGRTGS